MPFNEITLYPGNSQAVRLDGLYDSKNDVFPATATVTATLLDADLLAVPGFDNLVMDYIVGTPSSYQVLLDPNEFDPPAGSYTLEVTATTTLGSVLQLDIPATVAARVS